MQDGLAEVTRERDLYRQLLELGFEAEPERFLEKALALFIELSRARRGFLELRETRDPDAPRLSICNGLDETDLSPGGFSRSVIAEALASGETVVTASAVRDPRFQDRKSVRAQQLEAVLCAPISMAAMEGVVYLQDRRDGGPFSAEDCQRAEVFARHVALSAEQLLSRLRRRAETDPTLPFRRQLKVDGIVGSSEALAIILQQVALVARLPIGLLITGQSGSGKTQLARAIHENSPRSRGPFIELNCATLQEELAGNELFGAKAGAHSTASQRTEGKIAAADGGTLFLDEVAEIPMPVQARLLQFLQSGTYFPLGDSTARCANVRVIAATNVDLGAAVASKLFREDLYFRLNVFPLRTPSLAERKGDIASLAESFCKYAHESMDLPLLELSPGAVISLEHADWPGNVRQLGHVLQRGIIRAQGEGSARVERRHLFPELDRERISAPPVAPTFHEATRSFQRQLIYEVLENENWNVAGAARTLDLTRAHVYNLMSALGIKRPQEGGTPLPAQGSQIAQNSSADADGAL